MRTKVNKEVGVGFWFQGQEENAYKRDILGSRGEDIGSLSAAVHSFSRDFSSSSQGISLITGRDLSPDGKGSLSFQDF